MKSAGFSLLIAGWVIVLTAISLLIGLARNAFVLSGFGIEVLGLILVFRSHLVLRRERG
jgi:hypothetical protein